MRKKIVAGNWKMNKTLDEAIDLFETIHGNTTKPASLESILIFPPFPYLNILSEKNNKSHIHIGAQNLASAARGAFTGEVSAEMLISVNATHVLIGHSERRAMFGDTNEEVRIKTDIALESGLTPVVCCGEQLAERQTGGHFNVVEDQLKSALFHLDSSAIDSVIIAYEPVWAIGTGQTASSAQAEEMHAFIRNLIDGKYGKKVSENIHILYGGSCNAGNSKELFACPNIDGGLIGGASLKPDEFLEIINGLND